METPILNRTSGSSLTSDSLPDKAIQTQRATPTANAHEFSRGNGDGVDPTATKGPTRAQPQARKIASGTPGGNIYNADFVLLEKNPAFGQMDDNITCTSIGPAKFCPSERYHSRQQQRTKKMMVPIMCSLAKQYKPQYYRNKK